MAAPLENLFNVVRARGEGLSASLGLGVAEGWIQSRLDGLYEELSALGEVICPGKRTHPLVVE
jgi:hypothetical protein